MLKEWHTATEPLDSKTGTSRYLKSFLRGVMILAPHLDLGETSRQPAQPAGKEQYSENSHLLPSSGCGSRIQCFCGPWIRDSNLGSGLGERKKSGSGIYRTSQVIGISENFFEGKEQYSERLRTDFCLQHQVADPGSSAFLALGSEIRISDPGSGKEKN